MSYPVSTAWKPTPRPVPPAPARSIQPPLPPLPRDPKERKRKLKSSGPVLTLGGLGLGGGGGNGGPTALQTAASIEGYKPVSEVENNLTAFNLIVDNNIIDFADITVASITSSSNVFAITGNTSIEGTLSVTSLAGNTLVGADINGNLISIPHQTIANTTAMAATLLGNQILGSTNMQSANGVTAAVIPGLWLINATLNAAIAGSNISGNSIVFQLANTGTATYLGPSATLLVAPAVANLLTYNGSVSITTLASVTSNGNIFVQAQAASSTGLTYTILQQANIGAGAAITTGISGVRLL